MNRKQKQNKSENEEDEEEEEKKEEEEEEEDDDDESVWTEEGIPMSSFLCGLGIDETEPLIDDQVK